MKKAKASELARKRRKAREAIRQAWLGGATAERILADAAELDVSAKIAAEELERVVLEHRHEELVASKMRAVLWNAVAIATELGDVRAMLAAVARLDKLDATSAKEQAARAQIVDVLSLAEAVRCGRIDPYQAQAMRPLIELAQSRGGVEAAQVERYAEMSIEELGELYAEKIGARK